jgi:anti-sigma B factor antagonist
VEPAGELDIGSVQLLERQVESSRERGFEHVVIDLRQLTFMDSAGLRLLIALAMAAKADAWRLSIINGPPQIRRVFELTGTDRSLPFAE